VAEVLSRPSIGGTGSQEKLPVLLLALCYGLYGFFVNLAPYLLGGISEREEWQIFVAGWITAPLLAGGGIWLTLRARDRSGAEGPGLVPFLLALSALFWSVCFGLLGLSAATFALHGAGRPLIVGAVVVFPLLLLGGGRLAREHPVLLSVSSSRSQWICLTLPLLALLGAANFAPGVHARVKTMTLPWPVVDASIPAAGKIAEGLPVSRGGSVLTISNDEVIVEVLSRLDGTFREALPWVVFQDVEAATWLVAEGQDFPAGQPLLTLASPRLEVVVHARAPGRMGPILLPPDSPVEGSAALCQVQSEREQVLGGVPPWALALLLGLAGLALPQVVRARPARRVSMLADAAVLLLMAGLVLDPRWPVTSSHVHHYGFYLGPVNDLLHGKSLLVDINCQYGVLVVYFLAMVFGAGLFPFSYPGFSALLAVLLIAQYALVFALLRHSLKSQGLAVSVLFLILGVTFFSQSGLANLPSVGPLRFGLAYLVLAAAWLRHRYPRHEGWSWALAHGLVGVASAWSMETFLYTLAAHGGVLVWERALDGAGMRSVVCRIARSLSRTLGAILLVQLLLALHILWRSGEWPHWSRYLDYVALYSVEEFGTFLIDPWSPWALYIAVYFASAAALVCRARWAADPGSLSRSGVVAGMTTFGMAQFTYFLGRSHPNNLHHIAIPSLFLAAYWIGELGRTPSVPHRFAATARYGACAAAVFLAIHCTPYVGAQWEHSALADLLAGGRAAGSALAEYGSPAATSPGAVEAVGLVARHAADKERVALFLEPDLTTEALVLSGKAHVFPLSHAPQDQLLQTARLRALLYAYDLRNGDCVFLAKDTSLLNQIQRQLLERLRSEFTFTPVESTEDLLVVRLAGGAPATAQ
jgi:hypothetical protein